MGSRPAGSCFNVRSVCIIGAGPSGIAAAKYLLAEQAFSRVTIFEQRSSVGGTWNYVSLASPSPRDLAVPQTRSHYGNDNAIRERSNGDKVSSSKEKEGAALLTPLYDRLETNIPRGLMGFSDLDWPADCQLFPQHQRVLEYIERYADDVRNLIRFRTQVVDVRRTIEETWTVKTQDVSHNGPGQAEEHTFDAVIVANGHFNVPYIPDVPGMEAWSQAFPDSISHSKFYRKPEQYTGKKVIVVGNSASGIDIGGQIQEICQQPAIVSSRSESQFGSQSSSTKLDKPPIAEYIVADRRVRFQDGTVETGIDAVLYCTGYFYSFPFLNSLKPPLITTGERVENLYQHIFYRPHPTLAFLVLNQKIIPFPLAEAQSAVIARVFSGRLALPYEDVMQAWEKEVIDGMGTGRSFHVLKFPKDANYINMLHDWAISSDAPSPTHETSNSEPDYGKVVNRFEKVGKTPPYWGEKEYWTRENFPAIKKAFQAFGEERHSKRALEDVNFSFERWKIVTEQDGRKPV